MEVEKMTVAELTRSRCTRSCRTNSPSAKSSSLVAVDRGEGSKSLERQLIEHDKAKSCAMEWAEEVKSHLDPQFPSFVKSIIASNLCVGSLLWILSHVSKLFPKENVMISLIDENELEYTVKYIGETGRITAGWARFSKEHKLVNGDVLVFHLVKPTAFKVYIVREYGMADIDRIQGHLNICTPQNQTDSCSDLHKTYHIIEERQNGPLSWKRTKRISEVAAENVPHNLSLVFLQQPRGISGINNKEAGVEVLEGTQFSETMASGVYSDRVIFQGFTCMNKKVALDRDKRAVSVHKTVVRDAGSKSLDRQLIDHDKDSSGATGWAEKVKSHLDPQFLSFVKSVVESNIGVGSSLWILSHVCKLLPKVNVMMSLIDENEQVYTVKYLGKKGRITAGWAHFSKEHNLVNGDALVFHLVKPTAFKVYIVRAYGLADIDGLHGHLSVCTLQKQTDSCKPTKRIGKVAAAVFGSNNEEAGLDVLEKGTQYSETRADFEEIENLESFTIVVTGSVIDSQLSEQERSKYYELCCSQKGFLHDNLLDGIDPGLAAGIISQTIKIADAIQTPRLRVSKEELAAWDKKLEAFALLGMDVGFLRARVKTLVGLFLESKEVMYSQRHRKTIA